jgi:Ca2+-binding RTX toxin-like protein
MKKKKVFRRIFIYILAVMVIAGMISIYKNARLSTAQAVGDLTIDWGVPKTGDPIFVVNNMLPGDSQSKSVLVTNSGSVVRPVGVRGVKTSETGSLATVLDFKISKNGTDLYGGTSGPKTLAQFFTESAAPTGLFLSNLNPAPNPGSSTTYTFKVTFDSNAGNDFQNTQVIFDLIIGITGVTVEVPPECSGIAFSGPPIYGTSRGDHLVGTPGNDLIFGFEGGDSIDGRGGDDCLVGGDGGDVIKGGNGNDILLGGSGSDSLKGGNGNDKLYGGDGSDGLEGEAGDDYIDGGDGSDSLKGGDGNDILLGGSGSDELKGGAGNDYLDGGPGSDSLRGEDGTDTCLNGENVKTCEL